MVAYDVAIIGGGISGLSAGLNLALANKSVLLFDTQKQRNINAKRSHGLVGFNRKTANHIQKSIEDNIKETENIVFNNELVLEVRTHLNSYSIITEQGCYCARRIIVASGLKNTSKYYYGENVFECPFCESSQITNQPITIYAQQENEIKHKVTLLRAWSQHITVITDGYKPSATLMRWLNDQHVDVIDDTVSKSVYDQHNKLISIHFSKHRAIEIRYLLKASEFQMADLIIDDVPLSKQPIKCDRASRHNVSVKGIQLIGESAQFSHSTLIESAAFGTAVARLIVMQLNEEDIVTHS